MKQYSLNDVFILSTGSNLGDRLSYLVEAKMTLSLKLELVDQSSIVESDAVDYLNQPSFLNQILVFKKNNTTPQSILESCLAIEKEMGRRRDIPKGPRTLDIDILFWGKDRIEKPDLQIPHPRQFERSFIAEPLKTLDIYSQVIQHFPFPEKFNNSCVTFMSKDAL